MKTLNIIKMVLILVMVVSTPLLKQAKAETKDSITNNKKPIKIIIYKIKGIDCMTDARMIEKQLYRKKGIRYCEMDYPRSSKIKIKYDERKITKEEIIKAIEGVESCEDPKSKPYKVLSLGQ